MHSPSTFHLRLFGSPSVAEDDGTLLTGRAVQRHRLALLALLTLAPAHRMSRDKLLAYLWPESDAENARQLLNQAVYNLRKALGEEVLLSGGDDLRLNQEVIRADVAEFEATLQRADHERVTRLYAGPFMDGFFLSNAHEFEEWAARERERLAGAYARALDTLAETAGERGDYAGAVKWWKLRVAHDPYESRAALRLMQALEASGNRVGALQHAAIHARLLQEQFGAGLAPEVLELAERLRRDPVLTVVPSPLAQGKVDDGVASASAPVAERTTEVALPVPQPPKVLPTARSPNRAARHVGVVVLLSVVVFGGVRLGSVRSDPTPTPSIAVLPLTNGSADPGDAVLADGMTEELIATLAESGGLRVIASNSVFAFRNRKLTLRAIADSLNVSHVLEGGVQMSGSRLRVQVRLLDAHDGSTRWSAIYNREMTDVFAVQEEIARAVIRELDVRFAGGRGSAPRRQPTQNLAAYELYLRGNDPTLTRSDSTALEGLEYFRQAVALDSTYVAAWAGMARMYTRTAYTRPVGERDRYINLGEQAARRAVAIDGSDADAHATLGAIRMISSDFRSAERHLTRAIALDPSSARVLESMVTLRLWTGRPVEALAHAERWLELDPLSPYAHVQVALALVFNDRCDEALAHLEKLKPIQPPLPRAAPIAAQCYARKRMWPEAVAALRRQASDGGRSTPALLGYLLARAGHREEALAVQITLLERWRRGEGGAFQIALVYAGLGDDDQTFAWLDRSITDRSLMAAPGNPAHLMIMGPLFAVLRRDIRFERLRARLGLHVP